MRIYPAFVQVTPVDAPEEVYATIADAAADPQLRELVRRNETGWRLRRFNEYVRLHDGSNE